MPSRYMDWLKQAKKDLKHAKNCVVNEDYEWACFSAQQASEKAVKAVYQKIGAYAWGHSIYALLENLPLEFQPDNSLKDKGKELDKHYIPSRYPNSYPEGAPYEYYTKNEAERSIKYAEQILTFCENKISQ